MEIPKYGLEMDESKRPFLVKEGEIKIENIQVSNPEYAVQIAEMAFHLSKQAEEHLVLLGILTNRVIAIFDVSHGNCNSTIVSQKSIMTRLLLSGCNSFIVIHNHPSSCTKASKEDNMVCQKLKNMSELMDVKILDFIIVGELGDFFSFREEQCL